MRITSRSIRPALCCLVVWLAALGRGGAYLSSSQCSTAAAPFSLRPIMAHPQRRPHVTLLGSTFFDDLRKFFEGGGGGDASRSNNNNNEDDKEDDLPAGTYRVATIPAASVKPGGLRLFLMFYLMGQQNTPDRNSWAARQPSSDDYVVDFWYHDRSAVLTVTLTDHEIAIDRTGSNPSTSYLMQESVVVQGILDELQQCAFDESVAEEHRLLTLPEPKDAIEKARDSLAFA